MRFDIFKYEIAVKNNRENTLEVVRNILEKNNCRVLEENSMSIKFSGPNRLDAIASDSYLGSIKGKIYIEEKDGNRKLCFYLRDKYLTYGFYIFSWIYISILLYIFVPMIKAVGFLGYIPLERVKVKNKLKKFLDICDSSIAE